MTRFPRVCGDVSEVNHLRADEHQLSPRMRGCFRNVERRSPKRPAFPAYAGMFPASCTRSAAGSRFPRVCGDVSIDKAKDITVLKLSPRMRGCFYIREMRIARDAVFPAYAGMLPLLPSMRFFLTGFPRVCGDVSGVYCSSAMPQKFSPRMRGYFYPLKHGDNSTSCYL